MTIYESFFYWIISMVEDDPIPNEIEHLYFLLNFKNSICALSFAGSELYANPLTNFEYYPLEAYFFKNESFNTIKDISLAKHTVKEIFEKSMESKNFSNIFKGKSVYIAEKFGQVEYKF